MSSGTERKRTEIDRGGIPAISFMVGAGALVAATSILAKALGLESGGSEGLNPFQISAGRFAFALLALMLILAAFPKARPDFAGAHWNWHLCRSLSGWLGVTCMFAAVARMPIAEATAISFLSPLVAMALAALLLGEAIGRRKMLAAALAVIGAVLILRPGTDAFQLAGLWALSAALFMGVETIFIKKLSDAEPALRILVINNAIGAILSLTVASFVWVWPTGLQWGLLVALGVIMVSGQALFIQSMKRAEASFVVPAFYTLLVFAAIYDFIFFQTIPVPAAIIGAALIVSGAIILAVKQD